MTKLTVLDMLLPCFTIDLHVVKVDKNKLSLNARTYDVHGALKGFRRTAKSKIHFNTSIDFAVQSRGCHLFINIFNLELSVSTASIYCEENNDFAKRVDTFIST